MTTHQNGQFVIGSWSDDYWRGTSAKTLGAAKILASKTYHQAVGGKIEVAIVRHGEYEVVAVKRGYSKWQSA